MNLLAIARRFNAARDRRKAKTVKPIQLRPDPEYRARKLAQMTAARRARYFDNARKAGL